jgi:hypothetical protein
MIEYMIQLIQRYSVIKSSFEYFIIILFYLHGSRVYLFVCVLFVNPKPCLVCVPRVNYGYSAVTVGKERKCR